MKISPQLFPFLIQLIFFLANPFSFCPGHQGKCDIVNSRVFSSRRHLRQFKRRLQQQKLRRKHRRKSRRVKRDRSLLAVTQQAATVPRHWPRWCKKVAFFRVFRQDFTLCLYTHHFSQDAILAYSNPNIGTTIYGYKDKKYYQEMGKYKLQVLSSSSCTIRYCAIHLCFILSHGIGYNDTFQVMKVMYRNN